MSDYTPPVAGTPEDMIRRQAAILPPWFGPPGLVPAVLRAPLAMAAEVGSWAHGLVLYARKQSRLKTMDGGWLDLAAHDFFGARIRRRTAQSDEAFRRRILIELFRPRNTRAAMVSVLRDLTGHTPRIFEPARPQDTGGIGLPGGLGVGVAGAIGSIGSRGEAFVTVYRTPEAGIAYAAGVGVSVGGVGVASRLTAASLTQIRGTLTDEDVRAAVVATRSEGIKVWMRVTTPPPAPRIAPPSVPGGQPPPTGGDGAPPPPAPPPAAVHTASIFEMLVAADTARSALVSAPKSAADTATALDAAAHSATPVSAAADAAAVADAATGIRRVRATAPDAAALADRATAEVATGGVNWDAATPTWDSGSVTWDAG